MENPGIELYRPSSGAPAYYVDAQNGSDTADGRSPATAWKSLSKINGLALKPGEVLRLARGSVWTGQLVISSSGSETSPICVEAYGSGEAPTIELPDVQANAIQVTGSHVVILDFRLRNIKYVAVFIAEDSQNVVVGGTEIVSAGLGISFQGSDHKALSNYIHDLHMINNTPDISDGDYGAVGIVMTGEDIEVAWNLFENCRAPSYDYGVDGGAVEVYGDIRGARIHHNWAYATNGFMEMAGNVSDMVIAYNVWINGSSQWSPDFVGMHLDGYTYDVRIENNTAVSEDTTSNSGIFGLWTSSSDERTECSVVVRNNIFVSAHVILLNPEALGTGFIHDNNLYGFIGSGQLGTLTLDATEKIGDPSFVDLANQDVRLSVRSPAIDSGSGAFYAYDLLGRLVPMGAAPDLGAYEYQ
jgi:hypothetical protein